MPRNSVKALEVERLLLDELQARRMDSANGTASMYLRASVLIAIALGQAGVVMNFDFCLLQKLSIYGLLGIGITMGLLVFSPQTKLMYKIGILRTLLTDNDNSPNRVYQEVLIEEIQRTEESTTKKTEYLRIGYGFVIVAVFVSVIASL